MKLTLQPKAIAAPPQYLASAAFIRGNSPNKWLSEISRWGVSLSQIDCYIMPESAQSLNPAGLFVVIKKQDKLSFEDMIEPYVCVSGAMYMPVGTQLYPPMSEVELKRILIWAVQVYHPTIGFVGFTKKDKIDLISLIDLASPLNTAWNKAKSGIDFRPPLTEIRLKPVSVEEIMTSIKNTIEQKPLSDIPEDEQEESSDLKKLMDDLKRNIFKGGLSALEKMSEMLSNTEGANNQSGEPSLADKLRNWLANQLDMLEKKRNDEINRLINLFDKDMDEALKYALPLDSPYMNRGEAPPSDTLGQRSTDFNLSNLGGGGRVDGWDLGDHYYTLQEKYRRAADAAIAKKDYKKAAYIYANLLADFSSAARVLEEGRYFQEAAVLYKDHLGNLDMAASCLERGGLTLQAIELFDELKRYEKVGDLYQKIEQPVKAKRYFEQSIKAHFNRFDFLEAARVEGDKLRDIEREMSTLLRGWSESNQSESCLIKYFDKVKAKNPETLPETVKSVYENETDKPKRLIFLNILGNMVEKNKDETFRETARNIAYEVLTEGIEKGNVVALQQLKKFLPDDRLIASDLSQFVRNYKFNVTTKPSISKSFQLDSTIVWHIAACHRNQYVVLGMKNNRLHLVRGNWYGNFEYYSWDNEFIYPLFKMILNQYASNYILIYASETNLLHTKKLPRNKYFDSHLEIGNFNFVTNHNAIFASALLFDGTLCFLSGDENEVQLQIYTHEGILQDMKQYLFSHEFAQVPLLAHAEMFHKHNYYYSFKANIIFRMATNSGDSKELSLEHYIEKMTMAIEFQLFRMAVITQEGCLIIEPDLDQKARDFDFFAKDIDPIDLKFISENKLVVIGSQDIHVYDVEKTNAVLSKKYENVKQNAIAVLNTNDRHNFAVLSEEGTILIYAL